MKVLELFAGSRSYGKIADELGYECLSTDVIAFEGIDLVKDVLLLTKEDIPFIPDIIVGSPPCTTFSIAAISHHRTGIIPKSDEAKIADKLLNKTIEILSWFPNAKFYIENPVGMMRKMPIMKQLDRTTVYYCRYGDTRMKPTDIWTNNLKTMYNPNGWQPRRKCWNGNKKCHHEPAPRGSKTGTQGLKNDYQRSIIPEQLCIEILKTKITINE